MCDPYDLSLRCSDTKGQCCFDNVIKAYDAGELFKPEASVTCTCGTVFVRRGNEIIAKK